VNLYRRLEIYIVLTVSTTQLYCSQNIEHNNWEGGAITRFGKYYFKNTKNVISVFQENGILKYEMSRKDSAILIESKERASVYQGWALFWDNRNSRLWIQSSDIGIFVWSHETSTNGFTEIVITPNKKNMIKNIPKGFYSLLPELDKEFCKKNGYSP